MYMREDKNKEKNGMKRKRKEIEKKEEKLGGKGMKRKIRLSSNKNS